MKKNIKYFLLTSVITGLLFYFLIPEFKDFLKTIGLVITLSIMTFVLIPLIRRSANELKSNINLGIIFYGAMATILIIGNISTYVIKYVFPLFDDDLIVTNIYWLVGIVFFSFGFSFRIKAKIHFEKYFFPLRVKMIMILLSLSLIGTLVAYYYLGFTPFFGAVGSGERFTAYGTITLFNRLWAYCVVVAVLSFIYIKQTRSHYFLIITLILSILLSFFFLIRMYPFLIFVSLFLLWISFERNKYALYVVTAFSIVLFFIGNIIFQDYRSGDDTNALQGNDQLNFIQSKLVYGTFNEFGQLKRAINEYRADPQYGLTFLSIPLGFLPAPVLAPLGIIKSDIQMNNSAVLMANWLESKNSTGIRIGILGELYINFKLYGCLFMFFIGMFVSHLQRQISHVRFSDWRLGFYMIFFAIILYSLIGQVDTIGSLLGNYTILFVILKVFTTKTILN